MASLLSMRSWINREAYGRLVQGRASIDSGDLIHKLNAVDTRMRHVSAIDFNSILYEEDSLDTILVQNDLV